MCLKQGDHGVNADLFALRGGACEDSFEVGAGQGADEVVVPVEGLGEGGCRGCVVLVYAHEAATVRAARVCEYGIDQAGLCAVNDAVAVEVRGVGVEACEAEGLVDVGKRILELSVGRAEDAIELAGLRAGFASAEGGGWGKQEHRRREAGEQDAPCCMWFGMHDVPPCALPLGHCIR